jgi:hypothetical protein
MLVDNIKGILRLNVGGTTILSDFALVAYLDAYGAGHLARSLHGG